MSIRMESIGVAKTRIYLSIEQGSSVAAETGLEQTRVVRSSNFLLDWFDGAESRQSASLLEIGSSVESPDVKSPDKESARKA